MTFFSTSDRLEIGGVPFISHGSKPNRAEALEYYRRVCSSWNLEVRLYEEVRSVKKEKYFQVSTSRGEYLTSSLILALGFYDRPFLLNIPGEELPKVKHYYNEPHPYFKQKTSLFPCRRQFRSRQNALFQIFWTPQYPAVFQAKTGHFHSN